MPKEESTYLSKEAIEKLDRIYSKNTSEKINEPEKPKDIKHPEKVILTKHFGFYDDDNKLWQWVENQVVVDPDEIKMLIERGAPLL